MMCFRDKTFCNFETCARFGVDCDRAFTKQLRKESVEWWGGEGAPVCFYSEQPHCFEERPPTLGICVDETINPEDGLA